MMFYNDFIERLLKIIDEDRSKNLDFLIYRDVGIILDELLDKWCEGCEYKKDFEDEDDSNE